VGSRDINALVACANIGSSSQPLLSRRESRRSVGDQCDVIPNPSAAASQNVALYRRLGGMSDVEVFEPTSLAIVSVAMGRTGESLVRPIASIGCCVSPHSREVLENTAFSRAFYRPSFGAKFRSWKRQKESCSVRSKGVGAML